LLVLDGRAFNIACGQIDIGNATTDISAGMATGAMQANGTTMAEPRIPAKLVAETVVHMANLPLEANIPKLRVRLAKTYRLGTVNLSENLTH
jgi:hypothetical protein